jgi:large subunit ribosomal protein L4
MRRLAIRSAFSARAADAAVALVDGLSLEAPRTKTIGGLVEAVAEGGTTLFVLAGANENVEKSIRNLPNARYLSVNQLNVRDLMRYKMLLIDSDAIAGLVSHLGSGSTEKSDA